MAARGRDTGSTSSSSTSTSPAQLCMENPGEVVLPITPNPMLLPVLLLLLHNACPWGHSRLHPEFER